VYGLLEQLPDTKEYNNYIIAIATFKLPVLLQFNLENTIKMNGSASNGATNKYQILHINRYGSVAK
jgi:hypothetical protein